MIDQEKLQVVEETPRPVWTAPRLTRIEIKQTLLGLSGFTDGPGSTI